LAKHEDPGPRRTWLDRLKGPDLPPACRETYRRHLAYALADASAAGILANAPLMALKGLAGPDWQLSLQMAISGAGMLLLLWLGGMMADRRKMPFVVAPGLAYAACSLGMAMMQDVLPFLVLLGVGTLFETLARPAVTAVIRLAYPATVRGAAAGAVRGRHTAAFLASGLLSAWLLDATGGDARAMIAGQLVAAAVLSAAGFLAFSTIRIPLGGASAAPGAAPARPIREAWRIVRDDGRFRRYLGVGLLYALGGMTYVSFLPVLFGKRLGYGYVESTLLLQVVPGVLAALSTGALGRWIDRVNPWRAWAWIRAGWGLDPVLLAATPALAAAWAPAAASVAVAGRACRGLVMGGSWILWWQVGVNHFAPPGGDTSRYAGIAMFANGIARIAGPLAGAWLLDVACLEAALAAGGGMVLLSAALSAREARREATDAGLATMDAFERGYTVRRRT
jgi:MFS family permease